MITNYKYKPTVYFILAFAITWINGFIIAVQSHQGVDKNIIFLLLAYMGPYIAALIMMFVFCDKDFRADFRKRIYNLRLIKKNYIPFTLFFLPITMVISILISIVFGQPSEQLRFAEEFKIFNGEVILSMIILVLVPLLEELGWRGYGVDSLASKFNLFRTSMIFGVLWGVWHLPAFFMKNSYQSSLWGQHPLFAVNFFVGIIPLAIIMNYLYYRNRRSIFLIALFHILVNYSSELFEANQISKCIFTLLLSVVAVIIVIRNKSFFFQDKMIEV
ncbi:MAG: CPBP family intramembrane metalloprotease [Candidatus Cloacimonetes bacterium]|nr:CPBP family intramembrane metalloprotease [Bacteroidota bacterium]MBL7085586.1 CPBP family intramembrane metalloprotease [Candidatus Cloacimonadota bacterium]